MGKKGSGREREEEGKRELMEGKREGGKEREGEREGEGKGGVEGRRREGRTKEKREEIEEQRKGYFPVGGKEINFPLLIFTKLCPHFNYHYLIIYHRKKLDILHTC